MYLKVFLNVFFIMEEQQQQQQQQQQQIALSKIEIKDENIALNVMVAMLNMAQRRGVFTLEESSKCWECVQKFTRQPGQQPGQQQGQQPEPSKEVPENITLDTVESASI